MLRSTALLRSTLPELLQSDNAASVVHRLKMSLDPTEDAKSSSAHHKQVERSSGTTLRKIRSSSREDPYFMPGKDRTQ